MRSTVTSALVCAICALALTLACSRGPATGAAAQAQTPAVAGSQSQPQDATPAGGPNIPMAVAHAGDDGVTQHAAPQAGTATMPSETIAQPPGGTSVADVWAKRQALAGKTVTVRGKVVKFNGGIMDRNWLHLQDGTGKPTEGTHDLTVTTRDAAKVGDIVTATGVVAIDKDFTAGYKYGVIVEQATVK